MTFASRMSRVTVSPTLKVAAEADRLRRSGVDVVDLGAGEPDFGTPEHVKDAAHIIPGHGGVLDRLDSILFNAPVLYYYYVLFMK